MRAEVEFQSMLESIDDLNDLIWQMERCPQCVGPGCEHHAVAMENLTDIVADHAFKWLIARRHGRS